MACEADKFVGAEVPNWISENWNKEIQFTAEEYWEPTHSKDDGPPDGLKSLVHVVARATREGKHLKALGSGWAFEDIAKSDAWVVRIKELRRPLDYVLGNGGAALTDGWRTTQADPNADTRLVHVEAGIEIGELSAILEADGLALPTLGGSNGQSLAGALSTSTHGGNWKQPPLPDLVRAIHLVTDGGRELWIEREQTLSITQDDRLQPVLPCPDTEIVRDNEIFDAALVACGRFGVIYAFVLEVRKAFRVVEVVTRPGRAELLQALRDGLTGTSLYDPLFALLAQTAPPAGLEEKDGVIANEHPLFFEFVFNSRNPNQVWVRRRWETTVTEDLPSHLEITGELDGAGVFLIAEAALNAIIGATILIPVVGPLVAPYITGVTVEMSAHAVGRPMTRGDAIDLALNAIWKLPLVGNDVVNAVADSVLTDNFSKAVAKGRRGPHHIITSGTRVESHDTDLLSDSIELVFDATSDAYIDFLDTILTTSPSFRQAGYVSVRPSLSSQATLSMHNTGTERAVSIECASPKGLPDNFAWMEYLQREALQRGGRPHWGQVNKLDDVQVLTLYGQNVIRWREALLRVSQESTVFSNHFTRQRGLEPVEIPREVTAVRKTSHGIVTHLCGAAGTTWSPVTVAEAMRQIDAGVARYHTKAGNNVAAINVVHAADGTPDYLRTAPDSAPENNLDNLPPCGGP